MSGKATFPMLDGPPITRERAQEIYREYSCLYGTQQSLQRIQERGGFGYSEVPLIQKRHAERRARGLCTCSNR